MINKVKQYIETNQLARTNHKILVALSGGRDSVLLLLVLKQLGYNVGAAHCNFQLRGPESDGDEDFVKNLCKQLNVPIWINKINVQETAAKKGNSIQMEAREVRYRWFQSLCDAKKYDCIATAHHLEDVLETTLINLTRGTGLKGLRGIQAKRDNIIRPLLCLTREEINDYIFMHKISFREDSSNASKKYFRNKIRHSVIPVLKELNPSVFQAISKTQKRLQRTEAYWQKGYENWLEEIKHDGQIKIPNAHFHNENQTFIEALLLDYGFSNSDIETLFSAELLEKGKMFLGKGTRLVKAAEVFELSELKNSEHEKFLLSANNLPINIQCDHVGVPNDLKTPSNEIYVDAQKINGSLYIKKWENGDFFIPLGMGGKQKISDYFINNKFSLIDKENAWLLCDEENVIWIINHRMDNRLSLIHI